MNYNLIAKIVALFSFLGMGIIVFRKIPVLVSLPEREEKKEKRKLILFLKEKINPFKKISFDIILQKILYGFRILTLKADNKTFKILQELKKRALERKKRMEDNYWEEIKKKMLK